MGVCIPKEFSDKFLKSLQEGKIKPDELINMTSEERRSFFNDIVGKEDSKAVNALFESKLLLKDQKRGLVTWAKQVSGISETVRRDMVTKIENMTEVLDAKSQQTFLEDLASKKLGTDVSFEEAKQIADLSKQLTESKANLDNSEPVGSSKRLDYGAKQVALQNYVADLKLSNKKTSLLELPQKIASSAKGIKASLDNSAIFRQGWKTLFTNPGIWAENAAKSFADIARQLGKRADDNSIVNGIKADLYSRPNALDGKYRTMKLDIGVEEEAYPSTLPEKIPLFNRLYKASETAYTGFLYRMRADIADKYIQIADGVGVDITDKAQLQSIGNLVNSLTGRGNIGRLESFGKQINSVFFSPKMLKSSFDFLTAHQLQRDVTPFVRKQAIINLIKVGTGVAIILGTAKAINPNSVDFDPRSSDFGKIRVGNTRFDVTAGMSSLITLTARILSGSSKSSTTGKVTQLNSGKFGSQTKLDVAWDFALNKLSPVASVVKDLAKGQDFNGNKPTVSGELQNAFVPLPITNIQELISTPGAANVFLASMMDSLGIATNSYSPKKKK